MKAGKHEFKFGSGLLSGNVGQAVVLDGGSVDHGANGLPVRFLVQISVYKLENGSQIIYIILQHSNYMRLGK